MNFLLQSMSSQTIDVYNLLIKNQTLTVKQIGTKLNILPNVIYRSIKPLVELRCIEELDTYPTQFRIKPSNQALDSYLLASRDSFLKTFFPDGIASQKPDTKEVEILNLSFTKNRDELLEQSNQDIKKAKKQVNFIISGLEVPTETILGFKQAFDRGVNLRFLVQRLDEVNKEMLKNWKKMGIEVRYILSLEVRIIIIDSKIAYITSYNPKQQEEGIGIRFDYQPIAKLMNELFERRWKISKSIS